MSITCTSCKVSLDTRSWKNLWGSTDIIKRIHGKPFCVYCANQIQAIIKPAEEPVDASVVEEPVAAPGFEEVPVHREPGPGFIEVPAPAPKELVNRQEELAGFKEVVEPIKEEPKKHDKKHSKSKAEVVPPLQTKA